MNAAITANMITHINVLLPEVSSPSCSGVYESSLVLVTSKPKGGYRDIHKQGKFTVEGLQAIVFNKTQL